MLFKESLYFIKKYYLVTELLFLEYPWKCQIKMLP